MVDFDKESRKKERLQFLKKAIIITAFGISIPAVVSSANKHRKPENISIEYEVEDNTDDIEDVTDVEEEKELSYYVTADGKVVVTEDGYNFTAVGDYKPKYEDVETYVERDIGAVYIKYTNEDGEEVTTYAVPEGYTIVGDSYGSYYGILEKTFVDEDEEVQEYNHVETVPAKETSVIDKNGNVVVTYSVPSGFTLKMDSNGKYYGVRESVVTYSTPKTYKKTR